MVLQIASYFRVDDQRLHALPRYLSKHCRTPDGGWNCRTRRTKTVHGSFHTTVLCLEGLLEYQRGVACGALGSSSTTSDPLCQPLPPADVQQLLDAGREFMLVHRLCVLAGDRLPGVAGCGPTLCLLMPLQTRLPVPGFLL